MKVTMFRLLQTPAKVAALVDLLHRLRQMNRLEVVLQTLERHLGDSFNLYRQQYADVLRDGDTVPETLFFLPFKNALYELSKVLHAAQPGN